jgi:hypothetical protein
MVALTLYNMLARSCFLQFVSWDLKVCAWHDFVPQCFVRVSLCSSDGQMGYSLIAFALLLLIFEKPAKFVIILKVVRSAPCNSFQLCQPQIVDSVVFFVIFIEQCDFDNPSMAFYESTNLA